MFDDIFDFIHRLGHIDSGDYTVDIFLRCDDEDKTPASGKREPVDTSARSYAKEQLEYYASERVCPCCGCPVPDNEPLDMAYELEDWLNDSLAQFGKKHNLVTAEDFEKICGIPAAFIKAVDNGEAIKYLCAHK